MSTAALVATDDQTATRHTVQRGYLEVYTDDVREWALAFPETVTCRAVAEKVRERFPQPWPDFSTIARWRQVRANEQARARSETWEREWSARAASLVPAAIVTLDRGRQEAFELMERAVRRAVVADRKLEALTEDDEALSEADQKKARKLASDRDDAERLALSALREGRDSAAKILEFCGATRNEPTLDPVALREQAIGQLVASGHAQTREQAEALFDGLAQAAGAPALGAGDGE
jgi:hypothetical protein